MCNKVIEATTEEEKFLQHIKTIQIGLNNIEGIEEKILEVFGTRIREILSEKGLLKEQKEKKQSVKSKKEQTNNNKLKSKQTIKTIYRKLINEYHPDKNEGSVENIEIFYKIIEAYEEKNLEKLISLDNGEFISSLSIEEIKNNFRNIFLKLINKNFLGIDNLNYLNLCGIINIDIFEGIEDENVLKVADLIGNKAISILEEIND